MPPFSRTITSSQTGCHDNLTKIVTKHLTHPFRRPATSHSLAAFEQLSNTRPAGMALMFDSGCGTGDSTRRLAQKYPGHFVIGVDRSVARLGRQGAKVEPDNMMLIRADLVDLYGLMAQAGWQFDRHFLFYPNPSPKPAHFKRRWHGSPVWPAMLSLGGQIELRTNWPIYASEFAAALEIAGHQATLLPLAPETETEPDFVSPFEKKYAQSGHDLWRVTAALTG